MKQKSSPMSQFGQGHFAQRSSGNQHPEECAETVALGLSQKLTTIEMAAYLRISPKTAISALSRMGHYLGMRPCKLRNGRLLWDAEDVVRVLNGEGV